MSKRTQCVWGLKRRSPLLAAAFALWWCAASAADEPFTATYGTLVDDTGNITLPDTFRNEWTFLGTWSVAAEDLEQSGEASGHGAAGLHNVYTQQGVAKYYRQHSEFPDGAVVIKELLKGVTAPMTTGTVSRGGDIEGWFVMVKDTEGRFDTNPLWGDGWGWMLFDANGEPKTKSYKTECLGCHIPAKSNDWIYLEGYLLLR